VEKMEVRQNKVSIGDFIAEHNS